MRNFLDSFVWAFLLVFSVPTLLIVGTWNALPGDSTYATKLGLERALAYVVSPSYVASSTLQMKYTERRLAEATTLLADKNSVVGMTYLADQVEAAGKTIAGGSNPAEQAAAAQQYIAVLTQASAQLEQQKQSLTGVVPATPAPTPPVPATGGSQQTGAVPAPPPRPTTVVMPTQIPVRPTTRITVPPPIPTATPVQHPTVAEVTAGSPATSAPVVSAALEIDQTQQVINQTIAEMQQISDTTSRSGNRSGSNSGKSEGSDHQNNSGRTQQQQSEGENQGKNSHDQSGTHD